MRLTKNKQHVKYIPHDKPSLMKIQYSPPMIQYNDNDYPLISNSKPRAFGDTFALISHLLTHSKNKYIYLNRYTTRSFRNRVHNIMNAFDTNKRVKYVNLEPNINISLVQQVTEPYYPTKFKWSKPTTDKIKIACQFVSPSKTYQEKRLSNKQITNILKWANQNQYEVIEIGLPQTVLESTEILSQCHFFLGICSGMSHLAHAVGIPCFIKDFITSRNKSMSFFHPHKLYCEYTTSYDAIIKMKRYINEEYNKK